MTSLYRRATPSQAAMLRIVEGAIKNASDAHPDLQINPRHRRSIAKRAAGTLSAQWAGVLAARAPSESGDGQLTAARRRPSQLVKTAGAGRGKLDRLSPLGRIERHIYRNMRAIKGARHPQYALAMIDVLKLIAKARAGEPLE